MPPFQFSEPKPNRDEIRLQILGPKPTEKFVALPVLERPVKCAPKTGPAKAVA
jgi:hypothetical protein